MEENKTKSIEELMEQYSDIDFRAAKIMLAFDHATNALEAMKDVNASDEEKIKASGSVVKKLAIYITNQVLDVGIDFCSEVATDPNKANKVQELSQDFLDFVNLFKPGYDALCDLGDKTIDCIKNARAEFLSGLDNVKTQLTDLAKGKYNKEIEEDAYRLIGKIIMGNADLISEVNDTINNTVNPGTSFMTNALNLEHDDSIIKVAHAISEAITENFSDGEIKDRLLYELDLMKEISECRNSIRMAKGEIKSAEKAIMVSDHSVAYWQGISNKFLENRNNMKLKAHETREESAKENGIKQVMCNIKNSYFKTMEKVFDTAYTIASKIVETAKENHQKLSDRKDALQEVLDNEPAIQDHIKDLKHDLKESRANAITDKKQRIRQQGYESR